MITEIPTDKLAEMETLSAVHLERRKKYITASDLPAIAGLDMPWRTAGDVYLDKVGKSPPRKGSVPAAIGFTLEPALRVMTQHVLGVNLTRSGAWQTKGLIGATLDDLTEDRKSIVQYKTAGSGLSLEDGPPPKHLVQVHAEMFVSETQLAYLVYLLGGQGPLSFRVFKIERDDTLANGIAGMGQKFMEENVAKRIAPKEPASLSVLSRLIRVPKKAVIVTDEAVLAYRAARDARLAADKDAKALKESEEKALALILQTDLEAEVFQSTVGDITYFETVRKGYTVEETTFRSAKLKEPK